MKKEKPSEQRILIIAAKAYASPKSVRKILEGKPVRGNLLRERIRQALVAEGLIG